MVNSNTKKLIMEFLVVFGKVAFTGIAYGLVGRVWRL